LAQNLCFGIYIPWESGKLKDPEPWNSQHGRIFKIPGRVHVDEVIPQGFWNQKGKALITGTSPGIDIGPSANL
jgi:hypothetical protein